MIEPVALVDMDNTLCDYSGAMTRDMTPLRSPHEYKQDLLAINPKLPKEPHLRAREELIRKQPGWWLRLEPLNIGFQILKELKEAKFDIHILTKGPWKNANAWTEKVEWCREHVPGIPLTITQEKSLVYGRVLVDDWPPYYLSWLGVRPRGLVVVPAHPWNAGMEQSEHLFRYAGPKDLSALRLALKRQFKRK